MSVSYPKVERSEATTVAFQTVSHSFTSTDGPLPALNEITFTAGSNETVALIGPSGCGKTTLLELACGLLKPSAGTIERLPGVLMAQRDQLLPWMSAIDNASLPLRIKGYSRREARAQTDERFRAFGLSGFQRHLPAQLSGGMRQRVAFLRTVNCEKPLLALDEPFAALDAITRSEMQDWLANLIAQTERTTLLATHDIEEGLLLADRLIVLSKRPGRIVLDQEIALPRPRKRLDPGFIELRERIIEVLGER